MTDVGLRFNSSWFIKSEENLYEGIRIAQAPSNATHSFRYDSGRVPDDARQDVARSCERVAFVSKYLRQLQDCFII
jgi:hypothetical protein